MVASVPAWQRYAVLAPVLVVGVGLVAAAVILLIRAGIDSWSESKHKRLIIWSVVLLFVVVGVLSYLRVSLPNTE